MSTPYHDPEDNLPDWLKALRQKQSEQAAEDAAQAAAAKTAAGESESEPDWLADIRKRHQEDGGSPPQPKALSDTQPNKPFRLESRPIPAPAFEPEDSEDADAETSLPNWLDETDGSAAEDSAVFPVTDNEDDGSLELPSWLQGVQSNESIPPASSSAFYEDYEQFEPLTPAEVENAGPLAGLSGVLPAEPEIGTIGRAPVFSTRLTVNENQRRHASVLQALIASETQTKEDQASTARRPARMLNLLMAGALLLAALLPLLNGQLAAPRPEPQSFPEGTATFNAIDILPAGAPVLVIFDVQPALYGELRSAASPVISHLLDRQARLVFISTQPTGPALAERLLQNDFSQVPLVASKDYVSLGYLPGGMAAVRSFTSDMRAATLSAPATFANPWQRASLQAIETLDDFAVIVLVVSEGEDARMWVEQSSAQLSKGLLVVSSAQAAPVLRAYLHTQPSPLAGLVAGVSGGAHYERLRARETFSLTYWDSYSYQLGMTVLLIVLGGLYGRVISTPADKAKVKA